MAKRKTKKDYYYLANSRGFKWLGEILPKNIHTKTWWECEKGDRWETTYNIIKCGCGCPTCSNCAKKTKNDYNILASSRGFKWIGKELPATTQYKTWWECEKGDRWETTYNSIHQGRGCPVCVGCIKKIEEDYHSLAKSRLFKWIGSSFSKNVNTKTWWECENDHRWESTYCNIYNGNGCPRCAGNSVKIEKDYNKLATDRGFSWIGDVSPKNIQIKTWWKCKNGHEWETPYNNIQSGTGCPVCKDMINGAPISKPQIKLNSLLYGSLNYPEGRYRIDVAIIRNSQKIAVEYDCQYWHEGNEQHDTKRDRYLISNGWKIIHVKSRKLLPTRKQLKKAINEILNKKNVVNVFLEDWKTKK